MRIEVYFIGFISFFIFLFTLYLLSREDHVFLRRDVTLDEIFNLAFILIPLGIFWSRFSYVLLHPSWKYLQPLVFLALPYFPGLSLSGGIIGIIVFLYFFIHKKKMPVGRIYDVFSLSFLLAYSIGLLLLQIADYLVRKHIAIVDGIAIVLYLFIFFLLNGRFSKSTGKDGAITLHVLFFYSFMSLVTTGILYIHKNIWILVREELLFICLLVIIGVIAIARFKKVKWIRKTK